MLGVGRELDLSRVEAALRPGAKRLIQVQVDHGVGCRVRVGQGDS